MAAPAAPEPTSAMSVAASTAMTSVAHLITSAAHRREATPITLLELRTAKVRPMRGG